MWGSIGRPLGQPVRLHPHEEAGTKVLRCAIELVDVALPVTHMHTALGRAHERDGLTQVLQTSVALLRLDRHARRVDVPPAYPLWDTAKRELLLIRDRLGIKPLYYYPTEHGVLFGSERKAILGQQSRRAGPGRQRASSHPLFRRRPVQLCVPWHA